MTRKTVFRVIVAIRLLPNFTAYWWMLPRRMKRIRTRKDQTILQMDEAFSFLQQSWERSFEVAAMFTGRTTAISPISEKAFRIPVTFIEGLPGDDGWLKRRWMNLENR